MQRDEGGAQGPGFILSTTQKRKKICKYSNLVYFEFEKYWV
jgi:hypothetical protein